MRPRFPLSHRARYRKEKDDGERPRTEKDGGLTTAIIDEQTRPSGTDQPGHRWKGSTLTQVERINPAVQSETTRVPSLFTLHPSLFVMMRTENEGYRHRRAQALRSRPAGDSHSALAQHARLRRGGRRPGGQTVSNLAGGK